ncbi:MAG: phosphomannomutase/phosphoglucomutase [Deltaproteobacteria bacterium]|nr:phosphomannomutase/phosphoglucomutase [Deltaproteobacteria bacterium]
MNEEVFREYDVRGLVDRDLDSDFVYDLGRAVGTFAGQRGVTAMTLGRDCRLSSDAYRDALGRGMAATGIDVIDIGLCATPILYFSIRHLAAGGGVMITGSHNPPEFNGFKICVGPDTIYGEEIQQLKVIMKRGIYRAGTGAVTARDVSGDYEECLFENVAVREGLHIAVDGGNGVGGLFALPLYRRFGCRVEAIHCDPDGNFPNHFPDPTVPENLEELRTLVRESRADAGIAFDGDADRIGVITDRGEILWGDELLLLFSRSVLKEHPGATIIGEVKCSQKLYDDIERHGGKAIMWKAGHSLIKGKMRRERALLAGEMSGHLFFADRYFGYDDALYASVRLLEVLSRTGTPLSELLVDVPRTFATPEIRLDCPDSIKFQVVEEARETFRRRFDVIDIDGVRIPMGDGWGLVRASNTQPVLVLRFEAATEERLNDIRQSVESVLREIMGRHGAA